MMALARRGAGVALAGLTAATAVRYRAVKQRQGQLPSHALAPIFDEKDNTTPRPQQQQQRVIIIGAGVVGVSTAYKLAQRGHQVVVLEPMPEPGEECSACAAGGMSRQNVVVDKNTWTAVLACLATPWRRRGENDFEFFRISWFDSLSDPFFLRWAAAFTKTSFVPPSDYAEKQRQMLRFTDYAVGDMVQMFDTPRANDDMAKKAGYNTRGSLAVSYDIPTTGNNHDKAGSKEPDAKSGNTLEPNRILESTQEVLKEEPSLRFQARPPVSAKFEYEVKAASAGRFTKELARQCVADHGVQFWYDTKVQGISTTTTTDGSKKPRISELRTNRGVISVPENVHVVVATGAWTPHVLALMDLYAPVYPLKGYSMSVSAKEALASNPALRPSDLPSRIVCDKYMYTTRLGDEIRITSIGEFSEWSTQPTPRVDANFRREAVRQFPQLKEWIQRANTNCGHRPYVADGILLLGAVDSYERLYVSCGPGSNGWKLALGSGEVMARLVSGQTAEQIREELGFDAAAFSPAGRVLYAPVFAKVCRARWNV